MKRFLLALTVAALYVVAPVRAHAQGPSFIVVVNSANATKSLSKEDVSNFFLKKVTKWDNGKTVVPVDQDKGNKVREAFSKAVHGRSASAIESYWQQQIFSGKDIPPSSKDGDADVLAFVKGNANAIGYVPAGTALGEGVKAIPVTGL